MKLSEIVDRFEMTRRQLLKALGGGLLVAILPAWVTGQRRGQQAPQNVDAWLHIAPDGRVTVLTGKVEVGQGSRTSLTQAVAEELRVDPSAIKVVMGDTDLVPYDRGTFGSRTTPTMVPQLRRAAAAVRESLTDQAAKKLGVPREQLTAVDGRVSAAGSGPTLSYGELAEESPLGGNIPRNVVLTPPEDWSVMGNSLPKVDGEAIVTGRHRFSSDMTAEGVLHAKVLRRPSLGATIASIDTSEAESMPDVHVVRDGEFVAVAAPTLRLAKHARDSIKVEWSESSNVSTENLRKLFGAPQPPTSPVIGDKTTSETYTCAYIAHAPLEPRAALAVWDGERMTVHTGTQRPFGVRPEVAHALGLPESAVRVIVPDTGSGYGGKHSGDAAVEAARVSKALGVPIKLIWTRQEEFNFAYCRPGGVIDIQSGANDDGTMKAWRHDNYNSGGSAIDCPYDVSRPHTQSHRVDSPVRQGSYRGLAATFNCFARETNINELGHAVGMDELEFRLKNLSDERLRAVLVAAAESFGWGETHGKYRGHGIACGVEKGSYVATAAEVEVDPVTKNIRVVRATTAFECGKIINPSNLQSQVEGCVVQGIGCALFERIEYRDGKNRTDLFALYRMPRFSDTPKLETILLDRPDLPSAGAGETPIMTIAPAINGGVFQSTGVRLRSLPLEL